VEASEVISWAETREIRCIRYQVERWIVFVLYRENEYNMIRQPWPSFSIESGRRQQIWDIDYFVEGRLLRVSNL